MRILREAYSDSMPGWLKKYMNQEMIELTTVDGELQYETEPNYALSLVTWDQSRPLQKILRDDYDLDLSRAHFYEIDLNNPEERNKLSASSRSTKIDYPLIYNPNILRFYKLSDSNNVIARINVPDYEQEKVDSSHKRVMQTTLNSYQNPQRDDGVARELQNIVNNKDEKLDRNKFLEFYKLVNQFKTISYDSIYDDFKLYSNFDKVINIANNSSNKYTFKLNIIKDLLIPQHYGGNNTIFGRKIPQQALDELIEKALSEDEFSNFFSDAKSYLYNNDIQRFLDFNDINISADDAIEIIDSCDGDLTEIRKLLYSEASRFGNALSSKTNRSATFFDNDLHKKETAFSKGARGEGTRNDFKAANANNKILIDACDAVCYVYVDSARRFQITDSRTNDLASQLVDVDNPSKVRTIIANNLSPQKYLEYKDEMKNISTSIAGTNDIKDIRDILHNSHILINTPKNFSIDDAMYDDFVAELHEVAQDCPDRRIYGIPEGDDGSCEEKGNKPSYFVSGEHEHNLKTWLKRVINVFRQYDLWDIVRYSSDIEDYSNSPDSDYDSVTTRDFVVTPYVLSFLGDICSIGKSNRPTQWKQKINDLLVAEEDAPAEIEEESFELNEASGRFEKRAKERIKNSTSDYKSNNWSNKKKIYGDKKYDRFKTPVRNLYGEKRKSNLSKTELINKFSEINDKLLILDNIITSLKEHGDETVLAELEADKEKINDAKTLFSRTKDRYNKIKEVRDDQMSDFAYSSTTPIECIKELILTSNVETENIDTLTEQVNEYLKDVGIYINEIKVTSMINSFRDRVSTYGIDNTNNVYRLLIGSIENELLGEKGYNDKTIRVAIQKLLYQPIYKSSNEETVQTDFSDTENKLDELIAKYKEIKNQKPSVSDDSDVETDTKDNDDDYADFSDLF